METNETTVPRDKFQLRAYLERLDLQDSISLQERAREIFDNIDRVMTPYYVGERGEPLQGYYLSCKRMIDDARLKNDFRKDIPLAIDYLIGSLEWE